MKECASHGKPLLISAREVTSLTVKTIGQVKFMGNSRNPLSQFFRAKSIDTPKKSRFSLTLIWRYSENFCATYPIWALACVRACRRLTPATERKPLVAGNSPQSILKVVVLPAPFGPKSPKISPSWTSKEVLETAVKSPNLRTRFLTMIFTFRGLDSAS